MNISVIKNKENASDVVLQKTENSSLFCEIHDDEFMVELYNLLIKFPQNYEIHIHDYVSKRNDTVTLDKSNIKYLDGKEYNFKKSQKFLTGK